MSRDCPQCSAPACPSLPSLAEEDALCALLRSNTAPSSADTAHFLSVEKSAASELAVMDAYLNRLQRLVEDVQQKRDRLNRYLEGARSVLGSPIRQLPTEILAHVFELYARSHSEYYELANEASHATETNRHRQAHLHSLARVCNRWHAIVIGTPRLWDSVAVDTEVFTDAHLTLVERNLARSGSTPLHIDLSLANESTTATQRVLALLIETSPRWTSFFVNLIGDVSGDLDGLRGRLDSLETLELSTPPDHWDGVSTGRIFETAPRLRYLMHSGQAKNLPSTLPFSQLTTFEYRNEGARIRLELLPWAALTKCKTFRLEGDVVQLPSVSPPHTVSLVNLDLFLDTSSMLRDHEVEVLERIFGAFTLPALRSLEVHPLELDTHPPTWSQPAFLALATRSGFERCLRSLTLDVDLLAWQDVLVILDRLAALEHLVVTEGPNGDSVGLLWTPELVRALTEKDSSAESGGRAKHAPQLGSLTVYTDGTVAAELVEEMVLFRTNATQRGAQRFVFERCRRDDVVE